MRGGDYWKERFEQIEQAEHTRGLQCCAEIETQYRQAQRSIEGQLAAWYQRLADNNGVSMQEARRLVTGRELEEFKWDVNQYIKRGEENALNGQWIKELENASARYHISRLEAIQLQMQQQIEVAFGNQLDSIDSAMRGIYTDGYYRTAYEIQRGVGVGWNFATLDQKRVDRVINKPWAQDGRNFSDRVWANKQKLVSELNTTLTQGIVLGKDPREVIGAMTERLNVSKSVAGRLVMTESAAFASAGQRACFSELGVEEYEIVATLDSHTSTICRDMDGLHFKMSEWEVGVTAPPFHVWCRTTTVPYFEDDFGEPGERAAKDAAGKTYMVPADTTYKEWSKAFVDGDKTGFQTAGEAGKIEIKGHPDCEFAKKFGDHYSAVLQRVKDCPNVAAKRLWDLTEEKIRVGSTTHKGTAHCDSTPKIFLNIENAAAGSGFETEHQVTFHESAHAIDRLCVGVPTSGNQIAPRFSGRYEDGKFNSTIKQEVDEWVSGVDKEMKSAWKEHKGDWQWLRDHGYILDGQGWSFYEQTGRWPLSPPKYRKAMAYAKIQAEIKAINLRDRGDLSDILEGATNATISCGVGHGKRYWKDSDLRGTLAAEAFAEMYSATMTNPGSLETIKKYLPKSYEVFTEMLEVLVKEVEA